MGKQDILNWIVGSISQIYSALNFIMNNVWSFTAVPKYLNYAAFSNALLPVFILWFCSAL